MTGVGSYYGGAAALGVLWTALYSALPQFRPILFEGAWFNNLPYVFYPVSAVLVSLLLARCYRRFFRDPGDTFRRLLYANILFIVMLVAFSFLVVTACLITGDMSMDGGDKGGTVSMVLTHYYMMPIIFADYLLSGAIIFVVPTLVAHMVAMHQLAKRFHPELPPKRGKA